MGRSPIFLNLRDVDHVVVADLLAVFQARFDERGGGIERGQARDGAFDRFAADPDAVFLRDASLFGRADYQFCIYFLAADAL